MIKKKIRSDYYFRKKISIKGSNFDAINFSKNFNQKQDNNIIKNINKEIEIDLDNITVPLSKKIKADFKLIGKIEKGEFTKISSKGSFGKWKFPRYFNEK